MRSITRFAAGLALTGLMASPLMAEPVTYGIDSTHTFPRFSYDHMGFSTQVNRFTNTTGTIVYDKEANTAEVDIVIDMTSVQTGAESFNGHIQGEDFFDTANHPEATFKSTDVHFEDGVPSTIDGELTIKGITKAVTLEVQRFNNAEHPMLERDAIGADATVMVKRSDFEADKYAPLISDDVRIDIALEAIAQ
ncbi:MAG TPA: YceI family protein [Burkholderiaceae bacterium]|nr:YceI family protein [Burkholderiaceae bacterium]